MFLHQLLEAEPLKRTKHILGLAVLAILPSTACAQSFMLTSPDLQDRNLTNANFLREPYSFGCSGGNTSPRFSWSNAPADTKSFVLTVHDLDAPTGIGWMH